MKKMDKSGLLLCDMQGKIFETSLEATSCSSDIFIRRFMNSSLCDRMDQLSFLNELVSANQAIEEINEEYGVTAYGKTRYSKDELFWIGYIFRYTSYVFEINSKHVYKLIKGNELRKLYLPYHTLDPLHAIDRILEAKGIELPRSEEERIARGVKILRRIKNSKLK